MSKYTLKFYKGRTLIAEQSFDPSEFDEVTNEVLADQVAYEAASAIQEAIVCNPPSEKVFQSCTKSGK